MGEEWELLAATFSPGSGWQPAELVFRHSDIALEVTVAVDPTGNAMAAWRHGFDIWASRYTREGGWAAPELAESDESAWAFSPQLVVDAGSNALLLWLRNDAPHVWLNRYTITDGWGPGEPLTGAFEGRLAGDDAGNAVVLFSAEEKDEGATRDHELWVQHYEPASDWGDPAKVTNDSSQEVAYSANIAIGADGSAIVAWHQNELGSDGVVRSSVWANRYTPKCDWETAQRIEHFDTASKGDQDWPQIAVGPNGHGFVTWLHHWVDDVPFEDGADVRANHFTPGVGWGDAEIIGPAYFSDYWSAERPRVVVDDLGNAIVVWQQGGPDASVSILFNRYLRSTSWGAWGFVSEVAEADVDYQCCAELFGLHDGKATALWTERRANVSGFWTSRFE